MNSISIRLQSVPLLALWLLAGFSASAGPNCVTFCGTISHTIYHAEVPEEKRHECRGFEMTVSNQACFFMTTNPVTGWDTRAELSGGQLSVHIRGRWTNEKGQVVYPASSRTERRPVPRDDGALLQYLWLAFGCHSYFTNRSDASAQPIWMTDPDMKDKDEAQMGTRAFYKALPGSPFPAEVNYVSDGCDYFIGPTAGLLQKRQLRPPLNAGYTNFVGRTTARTNIQGVLLPVRFEIDRYAPVRQGPDADAALRTLTHTTVAVDQVVLVP